MTQTQHVTRIGLWSAVKVGGTVTSLIGFVAGAMIGVILSLFSSLAGTLFSMDTTTFGIRALFIFPCAGTVAGLFIGMIVSFLGALLFNIAAGFLGGVALEIEIEEKLRHKERTQ